MMVQRRAGEIPDPTAFPTIHVADAAGYASLSLGKRHLAPGATVGVGQPPSSSGSRAIYSGFWYEASRDDRTRLVYE
eukprot:CAMPEP_0115852576 /NCGR_PEP_ID=MMETSP0287-20121206/13068_1 /TAXON_ID=412157 /ORGANISM="Chrysochromulina rotalis, Strain UIO044" /LENGTH=76 /DNA_ID=CAMNT_0003306643 /DNA_START=73 /DNA_END=303 /DNA_ORIENTATION=-